MWYFTEVADWFDRNRADSQKILDRWVEDSGYNGAVMAAASTTSAFMTFGAGFVDLLRLGDGVSEGTLKGVGHDALRLFAILPIGRISNVIRSTTGLSGARLIVDVGGPNCFWVASAKALRHLSYRYNGKLFTSVEDVAKAIKMPIDKLWQVPKLSIGMARLQQMGAKVGPVVRVSHFDDLAKMIPRDGSVVMVAVDVMKNEMLLGKHAIYIFRNTFGQVRIMDRTVSATRDVYKSLDELAPIYAASALVPFEASVIQNIFVKHVAGDIPRLFIPVLGVIAEEK